MREKRTLGRWLTGKGSRLREGSSGRRSGGGGGEGVGGVKGIGPNGCGGGRWNFPILIKKKKESQT